MNTLTVSTLFCAFISLIFATVTATKSVKEKRYRWFSILCLGISAWTHFFFFSEVFDSILFARLHGLMSVILGPICVFFLLQFIEKPKSGNTNPFKKSLKLIYIISGVLVLGFFLPKSHTYLFIHAGLVFALIVSSYAFFLLFQNLRQADLSYQGRKRQIYLIVGGAVTLLMLMFDRLTLAGLPLTSFGNIFLIVYLYFIYQFITKRKVLDIEDLTAKGVLFFILAAILTFIYAIVVAWVDGPVLFIFNTFVASFFILILFEPIKSMTERITYRFFLKGRQKTREDLKTIQDTLIEISDVRDLSHEVLVGLKTALNATQAHFFLLDQEGLKFKRVQSLDPNPSKINISEILTSHDFIDYLKKTSPSPLSTYSVRRSLLEAGRDTPKERLQNVVKMFKYLNAETAVAFIIDHKILGFCCFINEKTDTVLTLKDLGALVPLSKQIAYTLRNLKTYDKLRERDRLATLGEMSAGLAHEIKNPLGAIKGAAQYLQPNPESSTQSEFLNIIVEEVDRLDKVVSQFLNYAKPSNQELGETNIGSLIEKTLKRAQPNIPADIHVSLDVKEASVIAKADAEQLSQVFLNLILNAVAAMPEGGTLNIELKSIGDSFSIVFRDSGSGIHQNHIQNIFIPFFTTKDKGTGLGLPISQKIIKAHHGDIKVESELHQGSKFIITLPQIQL